MDHNDAEPFVSSKGLSGRIASFVRRNFTTVQLFTLVVLLEFEESVQRAPTIRLLENAVCQRHYGKHPFSGPVGEKECKIPRIQERLAFVRGMLSFFDGLSVLLVGAYLGALADKRGRRLVLCTAVFGILCAMTWIYCVCHFWAQIPTELVWLSGAFRLIGGGPFVAIAMCITMASDISTEATRSKTFYRVYSAVLITDFVGPPVAYASLLRALWLPYIVCATSLLLIYLIVAFMPETLPESAEAADETPAPGIVVYKRFFTDWSIIVGLATIFLAQFRVNTLEILLPYTSVRFGWTIGETATLLSIVSAVNIVTFMLVLPTCTTLLKNRMGWPVHRINLYVGRISSAFLATGTLLISVASKIGLVIFALIVYAGGFGIRLAILAFMTSLVNSAKETAKLYSLVAMTDAIAHMIASPSVQRLWSVGLEKGGGWIVLPFVFLTGIFLFALGTSSILKASQDVEVKPRGQSEEDQSLLGPGREANDSR